MSLITISSIVLSVFLIGKWLIDLISIKLDNKELSKPIPNVLQEVYGSDGYGKLINYRNDNNKLNIINNTITLVLNLILINFGVYGFISDYLLTVTSSVFLQGILFFGSFTLVTTLISLPFSIYETFIIEEKYGFNKTSVKTYIFDTFKGLILGSLIMGGLYYLFVLLYTLSPFYFFLTFSLVIVALTIFLMAFYTSLIIPLFNKLTELGDGELKTMIELYAKNNNFDVSKIMVINDSKRTTKANAFFSGFGKTKKIVLSDNLISKFDNDEILGVLAHEMGHYKHKHILKSLPMTIILIVLNLFLLQILLGIPQLSLLLGGSTPTIHLSLIVIGLVFEPLNMITEWLKGKTSRKHEYEADKFACETSGYEGISKALIKLYKDGLGNPNPSNFSVNLGYSHPPLRDRLLMLNKLKK